MKALWITSILIVVSCALTVVASYTYTPKACWCWSEGQGLVANPKPRTPSLEYVSYGSYGTEVDWNDPQHIIALDYHQAQGKRVFYAQCVWCHADTTPSGPSNRTNVTPAPALMNDGSVLNGESDASLRRIIALGGREVGKSPMMPPYGKSLSDAEIDDLIAYTRAIAVPAYHGPSDKAHPAKKDKPR